MTQYILRRHTTFFTLVLACINLFIALYLSDGTNRKIQYEFRKEMLLRVTYISVMAEWVPLDQLLTSTAIAAISQKAPFHINIKAAPKHPSHEPGLQVSSGFPVSATKYSPVLEAYIELTEGEMTRPSTGSSEEFLATAACMIALLPLLVFGSLAVANLLAARQHRWQAVGVIWIGYLVVPCVISVGMLAFFSRIQRYSEINAWAEDVSRSASLYSSMFAAMCTLLSMTDTEKLSKAFELVNNEIFTDRGLYQVSVAAGQSREVDPPLCSPAVQEAIFQDADRRSLLFKGHTAGYLYAASPIPVLSSLILVLRFEGEPPTLLSTEYIAALVLALAASVCFSLLLLVFVFPFFSLGCRGPLPLNVEPWESRLSRFWPYRKVLETAMILTMCVIVFLLALARIAHHYHRVEVVKEYYIDRVNVIEEVQIVSHSLASCYTGVLGTHDWNVNYAKYTTFGMSVDDYLSLAQFYGRLSTAVGDLKYYMYSLSQYLMEQPADLWPLMSNMPAIAYFLPYAEMSEQGILFGDAVTVYDSTFLLAVLTCNLQFLAEGSEDQLLAMLELLGEYVFITPNELFEMYFLTIEAQEPYADLAFFYGSQNVTRTTFVDYYNSTLGHLVSSIEENVAMEEKNRIPPNRFFDLSYAWVSFTSFYVCYVCLAVVLGLWVLDLLYSAKFFTGAEWSWLRHTRKEKGREGASVRIETYDYTAPRSWMPVNMHGVRHKLGPLIVLFAALVGVSVLMGAVIQSEARKSVEALSNEAQYYQHTVVPLSERVQQGAMIEMGLAAWGRAYLSLEDTHVCMAIEMTNAWSTMKPIKWIGGDAVRDPTQMRSSTMELLFTTVHTISIQTSLLRQERSSEGIYVDLSYLLQFYEEYLFFQGYQNCFGIASSIWTVMSRNFLLCLVADALSSCYDGEIELAETLSQMCSGGSLPADLVPYLQRAAALRQRQHLLIDHQQVSEMLNRVMEETNTEVLDMFHEFLEKTNKIHSVDDVKLPWLILGYCWGITPIVLLVYKFSNEFFNSIYFN